MTLKTDEKVGSPVEQVNEAEIQQALRSLKLKRAVDPDDHLEEVWEMVGEGGISWIR